MSEQVYAPGRDTPPQIGTVDEASLLGVYSPDRGAGGYFAQDIQGATPKYARNEGERADNFRDSLCRFFVRVDGRDAGLFRRTIPDTALVRSAERGGVTNVADSVIDAVAGAPGSNRGYVDFLLTNANLGFQELVQVGQVLSGNHVVYTFDQAPPTLEFQGVTLNTVQDDQTTHMIRLYLNVLRATALARRQKALSIKIDAYVLTGVLTAFRPTFEGKFETAVPFSASFLVKRLAITEYTHGWRPTAVGTPFATDPNAVPVDTRVYTERPVSRATFRTPADLEERRDVRSGQADPRVAQPPPQAAETGDPVADLADAQEAMAQLRLARARREERDRATAARDAQGNNGGRMSEQEAARQAQDLIRRARAGDPVAAAAVLPEAERVLAAQRAADEAHWARVHAELARDNALRTAPPASTTPAPASPLPAARRSGGQPEVRVLPTASGPARGNGASIFGAQQEGSAPGVDLFNNTPVR